MDTFVINKIDNIPVLIEIKDYNPLDYKEESRKEELKNYIKHIFPKVHFVDQVFCWNTLDIEEYCSPLERDIYIHRIDFLNREEYSTHFNNSTGENIELYMKEIANLKELLTDTIVNSILFVKDKSCTEFGGSGIIIGCEVNNIICYSEFNKFLSEEIGYNFSFLE